MDPIFVVTIDTEVDRSPDWTISSPVTFTSVTKAVPAILMPVFSKYGVVPTFLLSPEVIEDDASAAVLGSLGEDAELGTHLHGEFAEPSRVFFRHNMAGRRPVALQCSYDRETEISKLTWLTRQFESRFGGAPRSFRAGRFGLSGYTLAALTALGYVADTTVTPGLLWHDEGGIADFRGWRTLTPKTIEGGDGSRAGILEIPVTILPRSAVSSVVGRTGLTASSGLIGQVARQLAPFDWLRPSFNSAGEMIRLCRKVVSSHRNLSTPIVLNMMFHNVELIPAASPYARTDVDAQRLAGRMEEVFAYARAEGYSFQSLSGAAAAIAGKTATRA